MTFIEWIEKEFPNQFIPTKSLMHMKSAWDASQQAEREKQKPLTDEQIAQLASGLSDAYGYHLTTETIIRKTQALLLGERV